MVLATGTCLVPDLPFTLRRRRRDRITIAEVGTLTSSVVEGKENLAWLAAAADDPARRAPGLP